jgi:serine/threonine-protein kinase
MTLKTPAPSSPPDALESSPGLWLPTGPGEPTDFGDTLPPDSVPFEQQIGEALHPRRSSQSGEATQRIGGTDNTGSVPPVPTPAAAAPMNMAGPSGLMGRYVLEKPLGAGGLGTVWAAYDTVLARQVAVKTLPLAVPQQERVRLTERVLDEARAAARLSHAHIVTVHDAGVSPDGAYIAMELLRGKDLSQMLRSGWRPTPEQAALIVRRVADALSYAHGKGVIHRDIKPANIFMVGRTRPVVLDFGIAQMLHQVEVAGSPALGSPFYAAPEQFEGRECDARTDVYSLGVVLYELLTGRRPYVGTSLAEIRASVRAARPRPPREINPALPLVLAAIALQAISTDPERRQRTAGTVARELRAWLSSQGPSAEPASASLPPLLLTTGAATTAPAPLGPDTAAPPPRERPTWVLSALLTGVLLLLLMVAALLWWNT